MADKKETDTASLNLYQKLAHITGEVGIIAKDGRNQEQKFDFISYAAVGGRLRELFAKYGVVIVPNMAQKDSHRREEIVSKYGAKGVALQIDFTFDVINADKPEDRFSVNWTGEAADFGDKATNKAATSALKYYLMRQFNISEKGEDPDAESPDRGEVSKPVAAPAPQQQPLARREPSTKELIKYASDLLERQGVTNRDDKVSIMLGIANLAGMELMTPNKIKSVVKVLREEDIDHLRSLYLLTADDLADDGTDEPNATVITPQPLTADDIEVPERTEAYIDEGNMDIVELAARNAEQKQTWVIPSFKPADLARPEQRVLIKRWSEHLEKEHPGSTVNLVPSLIYKDKVGTFDEAMKVLQWLADELNKLADEQKEAA